MGDPNDLDPIASTFSPGDGAPIDPNKPARNAPERYRVGRELARGGMGSIHEAEDLRLSRTVAIKQLLVGSAHARARFEREALITAHLQHPAVVPVYDSGPPRERAVLRDEARRGGIPRSRDRKGQDPRGATGAPASHGDGRRAIAYAHSRASCIAISSLTTYSWERSARRSSSTGAWPRISDRRDETR